MSVMLLIRFPTRLVSIIVDQKIKEKKEKEKKKNCDSSNIFLCLSLSLVVCLSFCPSIYVLISLG